MKKRDFIKSMGAISMSPFLKFSENSISEISSEIKLPPNNFSDESDFWELVRSQYDLNPDFINLESGYYNIIPKKTMELYIKHIKRVNHEGSFYMRNYRFEDKKQITHKLAKFVGCNRKNLVITRNTTESLDLIIAGYPWGKGDEVIYAFQDYGAMQNMLEQVSKRHQIVLKKVSVPNHPKNDEEIVDLYKSQITKHTKLIMVCHMINITGQILPIKKICDMAHKLNVEVLVDGAHCIGHFDFNINDLDCDYYGSSLHKWLATPLGAGILFIHDKHISKIWPLLADNEKDPQNINRLSHTGTHPVHTDLAIIEAMNYLDWIQIERKEKRLRYLKEYWLNALKENPNIIINTPFEAQRSCGIGNVGIKNIKPADLAKKLYTEFKIFTVAIDYANVQGCRISPNVFTSLQELDLFIKAMNKISNT